MTSINVGLKLLGGIRPGVISVRELSTRIGVGEATLEEALRDLESHDLLSFDGDVVGVTGRTKPLLAAYLHGAGAGLQELSRQLSWREFEELATDALTACDYQATRTFRMRKPTREIDVIGVHSGFAVAFDCKHWGRVSRSALATAGERQVQRCRQYLSTLTARGLGVSHVMPAILVLAEPGFGRVDGIAVVAVDKVFSFIMAARGLTDTFTTVRL